MFYVVVYNGQIFLVILYYSSLIENLVPMTVNYSHGNNKSYRNQI